MKGLVGLGGARVVGGEGGKGQTRPGLVSDPFARAWEATGGVGWSKGGGGKKPGRTWLGKLM